MIKTRLMALLSQAKKYIIQNVFWQWAALLAQTYQMNDSAKIGNEG